MSIAHLVTPDGRYFVVRGRLWRCFNPALPALERSRLTHELMAAPRAKSAAMRAGDAEGREAARSRIDAAKVALGERGVTWWTDRSPDDCVAQVSERPRFAHSAASLREADVFWTPEFEHPVQRAHGDRDLGRSTLIGARSQTITNNPLEAADVRLNQSTPVVARNLLPSHAAALGNHLQVTVSHRGFRLGCLTWNAAGAWRDDDGRVGMASSDLAIDAVLIVSTVSGERRDRAIDPVEQRRNLRSIVDIAGRHCRRRNLSGVGVYGDVQLAP